MDLARLVDPSRVVFGVRANNKEQLLLDLASRAAASLNLDPKAIFNALRAREEFHRTWRRVCSAARPYRRTRSFLRYVRAAQTAGPFRLGRCQARGSCFSPPESGDGPRRAPRRARRRLETPARQGIRRQITRSVKRCRFVQRTLRSPTFVTSRYADILPFSVHPSNVARRSRRDYL